MSKRIEKTILNYATVDLNGDFYLSMQIFDDVTQQWKAKETVCPSLLVSKI